jgi:hypothetical protein
MHAKTIYCMHYQSSYNIAFYINLQRWEGDREGRMDGQREGEGERERGREGEREGEREREREREVPSMVYKPTISKERSTGFFLNIFLIYYVVICEAGPLR